MLSGSLVSSWAFVVSAGQLVVWRDSLLALTLTIACVWALMLKLPLRVGVPISKLYFLHYDSAYIRVHLFFTLMSALDMYIRHRLLFMWLKQASLWVPFLISYRFTLVICLYARYFACDGSFLFSYA